MSLTTYFQIVHTSHLPLPPPKQPNAYQSDAPTTMQETEQQIHTRGLTTALKMLHEPELMISLNPLVQHYTRLEPTDSKSQHRLVNLAKLAPEFNAKLTRQKHSCSSFSDSQNGEFVHYEIVDKFMLLGGLTHKLLTYRACFRPLYINDSTSRTSPSTGASTSSINPLNQSIGLETLSDPGNGVSLLGKWALGEDEQKPGFLVLTETVQVHCSVLLGWYVRGQLESAHASLHKEFNRAFCERMKQEDPARGSDEKAGKTWKQSERQVKRSDSGRTSS